MFVNDVASFKRGKKELIEYKNELLQRMDIHFKSLKRIPFEYQREATTRFIEGLNDEKLKNKLRRHCKRERNTVDEAFQYVIDWESWEAQARIHGDGNEASGGISLAVVE